MELRIHGDGLHLDESVKDYTRSKIDRLVRVFNGLMHAKATYSVQQTTYSAELILSVPGGKLTSSASGPDCLTAFDLVLDKAERQLKKHKGRLRERRRRGDRRS